MPLSNHDFIHILFATCGISNYVIDIPIQRANAATIAEALLNRVVYQFGPTKTLIIGEDRTLSEDFNAYLQYLKYQITSNFPIGSWIIERT